ncbi:hypothetical protein V2J09_020704 [Rumex salicifolius]
MANTGSPLKSFALKPSTRYQQMKSSRSTPELKSPLRFTLGNQSSLAPPDRSPNAYEFTPGGAGAQMETGVRLMYLANEGDLDGIREMLDSGLDINFRDIDERTALHIASCQGKTDVVRFLLGRGAEVDPKDRWGSTPLADAIHYEYQDVIKLLEKYGAKPPAAPMRVQSEREVPEYEISPEEIDFTDTFNITKGTFCVALWRGIQVAVKTLPDHVVFDEEKIAAFRDELVLLQQLRHPNVVQFLGAVTQSSPMRIITEYLPKILNGDLREFLDRKGAMKPSIAVKFALDIASNILRDDSGHLKVADFGLSKLQKAAKFAKGDRRRYVAPEVFRNEEYDTKVDVFSFALILQEMIEGNPPFLSMLERDVPKAYCAGGRPPFKASEKKYPYGLKGLIEHCWNEKPFKRPAFSDIIKNLEEIANKLERRKRYKLHFDLFNCFPKVKIIAWHLDAMIGFPIWGYMKLLLCMWLVLPVFNGAAYVYENYARKYIKIGNFIPSNYPENQRKVLQMMSLDARKSVERYIEEYGPEAFERVVQAAEQEARRRM